jgi:hypothetical protein
VNKKNIGWVCALALLGGCTTAGNAIVDSLRFAVASVREAPAPRLNPDFQYLRLAIDGRVAYPARGSVDDGPAGPTEVWYTTSREVVRLANGRVIGATGATTEWRGVEIPSLPSWSSLAKTGDFQWTRVRDLMPGYRFGIRDSLRLRVIPPPAKSALRVVPASSLTWFEESMDQAAGQRTDSHLPPARYAVDLQGGNERVIYGEQCLDTDFCFSWQRWPPEGSTLNEKK